MCGIAGLVDFKCQSNLDTIKKMTDVLTHRGPDDGGYFFEVFNSSQIGFGHRRLSILDLSQNGHQPMTFCDLTIVYNGEVYNFIEIRAELEYQGYSFDSHSDTEVILKAYHNWGINAVHKFNGMFAIAIFDKHKQTLTLIRDRAGVKPLYWYHKNDLFMFSSEIKSFHQHFNFQKKICKAGLTLFFQYGYIPQPHTIFEDTYKLSAGHTLEISFTSKEVKIKKYWDSIDVYNQPKLKISESEAIAETEKLLKSACEYRLLADVPVGIFLSGGYDSASVTAILQSQKTDRLKTFSIGFNEKRFNEANYAKKVANFLGTEHTEYYCTQDDAFDIIPLLPDIFDEPFSDNSAIPTVLLSKLARQSVTVSLSADGGDEVFGGYDKYVQSERYFNTFNCIPFRKQLAKVIRVVKPESIGLDSLLRNFSGKYNRAIAIMSSETMNDVMKSLQKIFQKNELDRLMDDGKYDIKTGFDEFLMLKTSLSDLDKMMAIDFKTYQADDILTKVDRATMSVSLEGREPLLDYRLIEYVSRLESSLKINQGNKKYLLKTITHKYLPKDLMDRPKMGFTAPIHLWFKDKLKIYLDEYINGASISKHGLINLDEACRIKKQYLDGDDHLAHKVWSILVFQMWYKKWM
jgi:asparagine synthase (glutamine-hydrolysing)